MQIQVSEYRALKSKLYDARESVLRKALEAMQREAYRKNSPDRLTLRVVQSMLDAALAATGTTEVPNCACPIPVAEPWPRDKKGSHHWRTCPLFGENMWWTYADATGTTDRATKVTWANSLLREFIDDIEAGRVEVIDLPIDLRRRFYEVLMKPTATGTAEKQG
jgi:hypothetical protein